MSRKSRKKPASALVLRTLAREGGRIVCRRCVITGPVVLCTFVPAVPFAWRERAIMLCDDLED